MDLGQTAPDGSALRLLELLAPISLSIVVAAVEGGSADMGAWGAVDVATMGVATMGEDAAGVGAVSIVIEETDALRELPPLPLLCPILPCSVNVFVGCNTICAQVNRTLKTFLGEDEDDAAV